MTREYDLVLYGATGFVGVLTAKYLASAAPAGARIALAGRSRAKLEAVRGELGVDWGIVVADSTKQTDLDAMAASTKVVVTTVGPYLRYGLPLVGACAVAGTHYADLTGEPLFVRECADRYQDAAVASGAKIVNSAGFDSVPSDLNSYLLYKQSLADNTGELTDTTLVATMNGGASGGTIDSGRALMEEIADDFGKRTVVTDPYALSPDRALEPDLGAQRDLTVARANTIDPSLKGWVTTFVMAVHNAKVVRRSNALLGYAYGKRFRYSEVMSVGNSALAPVLAAGITGGLVVGSVLGVALSRVGIGRRVLDRILPKPGTGPSEEARDKGFFTMRTFTRTSSGAKYRATFAAQGDPGYKATAVLLGECGLALAFDETSERAGILTPAVAIGDTLPERYRKAGMTVRVERLG